MGFIALLLFGFLWWLSETDFGKVLTFIGGIIVGLAVIIAIFQYIF